MATANSCASMSDANGNLLFYTNGITVWDATHATMANGTGLAGTSSSYQGCIILPQPGSATLYYVFYAYASCSNVTFNNTIYYSVVDMSLASGAGSVTTKNAVLYAGTTSTDNPSGKLTATRHCNGTDIWLLSKDGMYNTSTSWTPSFRAFLITSAGPSTTAVVSAAATYSNNNYCDWYTSLKLSPNGKKLGCTNYNVNNNNLGGSVEVYDFDNSTGVVSNSLALTVNTGTWSYGRGCEFSPDATKLYASVYHWDNSLLSYSTTIYQWDLCAGSPTAIVASVYTVVTNQGTTGGWGMQLAPNGKIYVTVNSSSSQALDVINAPNSLGSACGYTAVGQSIAPKFAWWSLPNFMTNYLIQRPPPTPFTYTNSNNFGCYAASFSTAYTPSTIVGCTASGYSLSSLSWNFGDPASGANNTSTLQAPIHNYPALGTYTVKLYLHYTCGGGTDSLIQTVNITQPCISVASTSITCANLGSATVQALSSSGPFSYTWMPTSQASSVATGLSPGSYTITVYDFSNNSSYTAQVSFSSLIPLTGNIHITSSVSCFGAATGTGYVTNIAGGSGSQNYAWTNGVLTHTAPAPNNLSAGLWTVTVTDALTGCSFGQTYFITQPPAMNLVMSSNTPTTCAGRSITLTGVNSGGTPFLTGSGYTYTWTGGPSQNTHTVSNAFAGNYVYSLSSKDSLNCIITRTIGVNFVPNPTISVSNVSICPLEIGTLHALGATSYTWNGGTTGSSLSDSPSSTTQYSVIGSALSCTSAATGNIILKPLPSPFTIGNTTRCQGEALSIAAYGGTSYVWSGPSGYNSSIQNVTINPVGLNHAGVYQATVTGANSCTAITSATVTINPTPTLSAAGSTVCTNQVLNLSSASFPGSNFFWKGPLSFTSNVQNPALNSPSVMHSGNYTVFVTSAASCTNMMITQASVVALPNPGIVSNGTVCLNGTLNFQATNYGSGTLTWLGPSGFSSANSNTQIANAPVSASGFYSLNVVLGPCAAQVNKYVLVNPLPSFTMSSNIPCETKDLQLNSGGANNAVAFFWQGPHTYTSQVQSPTFTNVNQSYAGTYTLTVLDQNGCTNSATHSVTVLANPTLTPISTTVCLNEPATLKVTGAQSYVWTGPGSYTAYQAEAFIPVAASALTTTYTVTGTAANTCSSVTQAYLSTFELPKPTISVLPTNRFCVGSLVEMRGFGARIYDWKGPGNLLLTGQSVMFTAHTAQYEGTYTLTATDNNGCKGYTTTAIKLDPLPQAGLVGSNMNGCVPFHSDFNFYSTSESASQITAKWQLNGKTYQGKSFSEDFTSAGQHIITAYFTDTVNSCQKIETFVINAFAQPDADFDFYPEHPVENTEPVVFTNTSSKNIKTLSWHFFNNNGPEFNTEEVTYFFQDAGQFPIVLMVEDQNGCKDTVVKSIKIESDFNFYVPNAFTPNDDNLNDVFYPLIHGIKFYELNIFDRWGHRVFNSSDLTVGWDGTFGGQRCKDGVYVWKIKLSTVGGEEKSYNGHVTLFR